MYMYVNGLTYQTRPEAMEEELLTTRQINGKKLYCYKYEASKRSKLENK